MDNFLGFKTEEILTFLLLIVVGYAIAKMFSGCGCSSGNGFSVGAPSQCRDTSMGLNTICHGSQQWDGGTRDFSCPTEDIPNKNIRKNWCPDFCNFDGGDARCPTDSNDPLCTGVTSLNIPGIHKDSSGQWVNQCIKGPASPPPTPPAPTPPSTRYTCQTDARGPTGCIEDPNGLYNTMDACNKICIAPAPPAPAPVDENCTYTGDNKTKTISKSFKDYVNEEKLDELECPDVQIKIDECKDAWRNYYNDKGVQYDGSFCMQTLPDETIDDKSKGRGHCPLMHDANGKPYPANWITNGQKFTIDDAKNRCKLSYLDGDPVGTIDEQENAPGRYAWVSETNKNDCDCPGSPAPGPPSPPAPAPCFRCNNVDGVNVSCIQKHPNDQFAPCCKSNPDFFNSDQSNDGGTSECVEIDPSGGPPIRHNNLRDLKHKRNMLRDQLSQLETQA
jgi:hypothetical protein